MMKYMLVLFIGLLAVVMPVSAQEGVEEDLDNAPAPPPAPAEAPANGDVITLKNGKAIKNVQVIMSTPTGYEIEVVPGVTMTLVRKQVVSIDYDDIDPRKERRKRAMEAAKAKQKSETPFMKTSPELVKKLNSPVIGDAPEQVQGNFVVTLERLAKKAGVPLEVRPAVRSIQPPGKSWNVTLPAQATMSAVLDQFGESFPKLKVAYDQFDKVVIRWKKQEGATDGGEGQGAPQGPGGQPGQQGQGAGAQAAPEAAPQAPPAEKPALTGKDAAAAAFEALQGGSF